MVSVTEDELRRIIEWALASTFVEPEKLISLDYDFYWRPEDYEDLFRLETPVIMDAVGSLTDEVDLLRKSILTGEPFDIPDVVLERLAFLFLAMSVATRRRTSDLAS